MTTAEATSLLFAEWQEEWQSSCQGEWTRKLIPDVRKWVERRGCPTDYHMTQLLSGHGGFGEYLTRFRIRVSRVPVRSSRGNPGTRTPGMPGLGRAEAGLREDHGPDRYGQSPRDPDRGERRNFQRPWQAGQGDNRKKIGTGVPRARAYPRVYPGRGET